MNSIDIEMPRVAENCITYHYKIEGDWKEAFKEEEVFNITYSCDIYKIPKSVLLIPLLVNILPMAWVYDAEIRVPVCDKDFYDSIVDFKRGYINMFPQMTFGGCLTVEELQDNKPQKQNGSLAFFSGGVDAFCTLIRHSEDKPTLITLWGSDVTLEDEEGWNNVKKHLEVVSESFGLDYVVIKSRFRKFLKEDVLSKKVAYCGDGWWHGFQHGIGLIGHAAPVIYSLGKKTVYIASSFTAADKGKVTCASDPSIDNYVRFCGSNVIHDGYELTRQDKIDIITDYSKKAGIKIPLRVCWESTGGSNCCHCEKCWRTILGIYATGSDPQQYGFQYNSLTELGKEIRNNRNRLGTFKEARYKPIWNAIRQNYTKKTIDPGLLWFYNSQFEELETGTKFERVYQKPIKFAGKVKKKLMRK